MKKFSLALALLATGATGAVAQTVEDPGIAATFKNWEDRVDATYITTIVSDEASQMLKDKGNVKTIVTSGYPDVWGDVSRYTHQGGSTEEWINAKRVDGEKSVSEWPNALFCGYTWWKWGSSIWQTQSEWALDLSSITSDTHIHFSVKVFSDKTPQVMNITFFTDTDASAESKKVAPHFTLTAETPNWWYDSVKETPVVGKFKSGEWVTVDITLGELDDLIKGAGGEGIDYTKFTSSWTGRIYNIDIPYNDNIPENDGAVYAIDAVYFYTPGEVAVEPVYVGQLKDDATIEATFANWTGKKAIYDVMMIGDVAQSKLDANEDVTRKQWQTYASASGNLWRKTDNPEGDDAMKLECSEDYENKLLTAWPTHLFQIDEWQNWGDGHIDFKQDEWGVDLKHFNADTRFHFALRLYRNGQPVPQPINFYLFRQDENDLNTPRFSLMEENVARTNGNHADAPNPIITGVRNGDWMAVDVSLGELDDALRQMTNGEQYVDYSRFDNAEYKGNVYNIHIPLDNTNPKVNNHLAIDGIYFYTPQDKDPNGLESVSDESDVEVSVDGRQISVAGGEGIEVYNPAGMTVARTEGTTVNVADAAAGVYVVKAAGKTVKVVLK